MKYLPTTYTEQSKRLRDNKKYYLLLFIKMLIVKVILKENEWFFVGWNIIFYWHANQLSRPVMIIRHGTSH